MRLGLIWLLVLFVIEIWSIVKMSAYVGGWATLVLLVAGFIFGLKLMRSQGINAMMKAAQGVQPGESPLAPLATGIVKAFAGILLIIPGFVSDFFALLILLPFVRNGFARHLAKKGQFQGFANGSFGQNGFGGFGAGGFGKGGFGGFGGPSAANEGNVYEHDGSPKVDEDSSANILEGQVIELKPKDK
jgi:UPF0716 protein FxsA